VARDIGTIGELDSVDNDGVLKVNLQKSIKNSREVTNYNNYGVDSVPPIGSKLFLLPLGSQSNKIGVGVRRTEAQAIATPGEHRVFSEFDSSVYLKKDGKIDIKTAGGAVITMNTNGKIELNGNAKSAMTFQDFVSVWDAFITAYEAHFHNDPVSGVTGPPTTALTTPQKDMSAAENDKVLMNG